MDFGDLPVFDAMTYPLILVVENLEPDEHHDVFVAMVESLQFADLDDVFEITKQPIRQWSLSTQEWDLGDVAARRLQARLQEESISLFAYVDGPSQMGINTGLNEAFIIDSVTRDELLSKEPSSATVLFPLCAGNEVRRYRLEWSDQFLIYTFHGFDIEKYPAIRDHLLPFRERLEQRATKQKWFELQQPQEAYREQLLNPKIVMPDIAESGRFNLDVDGKFITNTAYFLPTDDSYLLAILNSRLITFCLKGTSATFRGGYLRLFGQYVEKLPIHSIGFTTQIEERDRLVEKGVRLYGRYCEKNDLAGVIGFVEHELAEGRSDVVHYLLAILAEQMIAMNKDVQKVTGDFWLDLEGVADPATFAVLRHKGKQERTLWKAKACRPFVNEESHSTRHLNESLAWHEGAFIAFVKALAGSVKNLSALVGVYRQHHPRYHELTDRLGRTDTLIDQVVYRLYGLTEEEIAIVEGATT